MLWKILGTGGTVVAAFAVRKVMDVSWQAVVGDEPPTSPENPETDLVQAVAWAALSGALIGLARMVATRQAAVAFEKITGDLPKQMLKDSK